MNTSRESWERKKVKKRIVANLAIVNKKTGQILLHKRVKEKYEGVDYWAFFGGRCDKWESPLVTVKREVYEELSLILKDKDLIYLWNTTNTKTTEKWSEEIERHIFMSFTDSDADEFTPREKHGEDATFFEFEDAAKLRFRNDISSEIMAIQQSIDTILHHFQFLIENGLFHPPLVFSGR